MEKFDGELEEKEEKPLLVSSTKLKIKLKVNPETAINKGKEASVHHEEISTSSSRKLFGNDDVSEENIICPVCNKAFSTVKSLHGHMRCHPDRTWRGMNPPKNLSPPITTSPDHHHHHHDDDDQVLQVGCSDSGPDGGDLIGRLSRGWPAEYRRGRTCGVAPAAVVESCSSIKVDEDEKELVMSAVYGLMLIAAGDDRYKIRPSEHNGDEIRVSEISPSNKKLRICGNDDEGKNLKVGGYKEEEVDDNNINVNIPSFNGKKRKRKNQAMQLKMKSYTCSICSKCFPTPQALGGHTSSAHNSKVLIKNVGPEEMLQVEDDVLDESDDLDQCSRGGGGVLHVCKICNKAFPTGQALGGHMRLHWQAPVADGVADVIAEVVVEAQGQDEADARNRMLRCFDLNEIPADDC